MTTKPRSLGANQGGTRPPRPGQRYPLSRSGGRLVGPGEAGTVSPPSAERRGAIEAATGPVRGRLGGGPSRAGGAPARAGGGGGAGRGRRPVGGWGRRGQAGQGEGDGKGGKDASEEAAERAAAGPPRPGADAAGVGSSDGQHRAGL